MRRCFCIATLLAIWSLPAPNQAQDNDKAAKEKKAIEVLVPKLLASQDAMTKWNADTKRAILQAEDASNFFAAKRVAEEEGKILEAMKGEKIAWLTKITAISEDGAVTVQTSWMTPLTNGGIGRVGRVEIIYKPLRDTLDPSKVKVGQSLAIAGDIETCQLVGRGISLGLTNVAVSKIKEPPPKGKAKQK